MPHVPIRNAFADAAENDERPWLQRWIEAERKVLRQRRPRCQPIARRDVAHAGLHDLEESVGYDLQTSQVEPLFVLRAEHVALVAETLFDRMHAEGHTGGGFHLADAEQQVKFRQRELV